MEKQNFSIKDLKFDGEFDESKRNESTISPQDAEKEINEAEWYSVEFYRDGGSMEVTTNTYIYWFGVKYCHGKFKYKPYVTKSLERKEKRR